MKQHLHISREPNFQFIIFASIALHVLVITLITSPFKAKEREYKSYFVNIVEPIEVQKRAISPVIKKTQKTDSKTAPAKSKPALKRRIKPKKGVSLEPEKSAAKEIERLRAISAITKQKQIKEHEAERSAEVNETISEAIKNIRKGKEVVVSGMPGTITDVKFNAYNALIQRKIFNEWIHPVFDSKDLEAAISFHIEKSGKITLLKIEKSSGNRQFDKSAVNAIKKASPLPPPPVEQPIEIRFHL